MINSADPDQLVLQRQGISGFSRTRINFVEADAEDDNVNANANTRKRSLCPSCLLKQA